MQHTTLVFSPTSWSVGYAKVGVCLAEHVKLFGYLFYVDKPECISLWFPDDILPTRSCRSLVWPTTWSFRLGIR